MKMQKGSVTYGLKDQSEELESFKYRNAIPKFKLERMGDVVNTNKVLMKRLEMTQ